ncbi:Mim1p [Kluyveromyces lactis]|uniref:KLLA0B11814p n=1 Tax=Kluyveromyces lactis (strain ATCC 8585 / CBS 2359 / DSM 70799 / NBRC 1267 / NRRL Y-1140 / WM37) TaxID=284590 RepID=Q6CVI4_KLULA|nr:uncharacterized protein KLLA0_B11814g [Kluyveromyces lactis]CAH02448.1 KLLA0B11814p [Kluyveromyces lactis]|eukprot:XP_452055.1 uncharacterized protein KLLA0_B11814g [Kluyveromyces lactis]
MAEEVFNDIPEELHATILSRGDSLNVMNSHDLEQDTDDLREENRQYLTNLADTGVSVSRSPSTTSTTSLSQLSSEKNGVSFGKILSFAGSCSINLVLPFINGLMLGFGELVAHELSWNWNWFNRKNTGYRIFPESRKKFEYDITETHPSNSGKTVNDTESNDKFL